MQPWATFTLHRYSSQPLYFCYGTSVSTLDRIKTVFHALPIHTVPDPLCFFAMSMHTATKADSKRFDPGL